MESGVHAIRHVVVESKRVLEPREGKRLRMVMNALGQLPKLEIVIQQLV